MSESETLEVGLLFGIDHQETRESIEAEIKKLTREVNAPETNDMIRFRVESFVGNSELLERVKTLLSRGRNLRLIVVSDELVLQQQANDSQPSDLGKQIRQQFVDSRNVELGHLCGLIGLVRGTPQRTVDLDDVIDSSRLDFDKLKDAITQAAGGIWLKMPNRHEPDVADNSAVRVQVVTDQAELAECFALRFRVYGALGYLADSVMSAESRIEVDEFDIRALHFSAVDNETGDVVGTLRLVLQGAPRFLQSSVLGPAKRVLSNQSRLCRLVTESTPDEVFRSKLRQQPFLPLPILQNSDFGEKWPEFLDLTRTEHGGEISRVVVSPQYQGMGISRLLMRAGIAAACELKKQFVLLECIPSHAKMYEKYGFQQLEGHHCRAQGLDQHAVGMKLELDDSPWNVAVSLATRDVKMLRTQSGVPASESDSRFLCLCRESRCWKEGEYGFFGQSRCPLRTLKEGAVEQRSV